MSPDPSCPDSSKSSRRPCSTTTLHNRTSCALSFQLASSSLSLSAPPHSSHTAPGLHSTLHISSSSSSTEKDSSQQSTALPRTRRRRTRLLPSTSSSPWCVFQQHLTILPRPSLPSWLSLLPSSTLLSSLYLPGTHESLAFHGFPISSCQSLHLPIPSQLERGVRFLDYRFSLKRGVLLGYHGIQNQFVRAERALEWVYEFLEAQSGECVVVSIKQENGEKGFAKALEALLERRREMWYEEDRWPTLGECRGRAVLFCRFSHRARRGLHSAKWPNNNSEPWTTQIGGQPALVQDWYSIGSILKIPEKAALVLSLFNTPPLAPSSPSPLRINYCSGATLLTGLPPIIAKGLTIFGIGVLRGVNERVLDGLLEKGWEGRGEGGGMVLLLDYFEVPGGLVEMMIARNSIT